MGIEGFLTETSEVIQSGGNALPIILDVAVCIILLIFGGIGYKKGFLKGIVGLLGTFIAFFIAYSFTDDLLTLLNKNFDWSTSMTAWIEGMLVDKAGFDLPMSEENLVRALGKMGLPGFLSNMIIKILGGITDIEGITVAQAVASALSGLLLTAIVGIALFLICAIILNLLAMALSSLFDKIAVLGMLNHILGFLLGAFKALIYVYIVIGVMSMIPVESLQTFLAQTYIISWLQENNIILIILGNISSLDGIINSVQDFINNLVGKNTESAMVMANCF